MDGRSSSILSYMNMNNNNNTSSFAIQESSEEGDDQVMMMDMEDMRRGPWTLEEDHTLMNYISNHGEGRWNSLARCAGLKRTGKSCRLRWLNYLRPDVRRGNITLEEQLMILELHSRWGNRWSKIAQHLPGRTDNEIKNYWRTRVQKHAKQLKCDVNSKQFKDTMKYLWMPRLMERIQAASASTITQDSSGNSDHLQYNNSSINNNNNNINIDLGQVVQAPAAMGTISNGYCGAPNFNNPISYSNEIENSGDSFGAQVSPISDLTDNYNNNYPANYNTNPDYFQVDGQVGYSDTLISPCGYYHNNGHGIDYFQAMEQNNQWLMDGGDLSDNLWNVDDFAFVRQQFNI